MMPGGTVATNQTMKLGGVVLGRRWGTRHLNGLGVGVGAWMVPGVKGWRLSRSSSERG